MSGVADGDESGPVREGSVVTIRGHGAVETNVTIVGSCDQGLYRLSSRTPLGGALLGRRPGDEVSVVTEAGTARFTIVAVRS